MFDNGNGNWCMLGSAFSVSNLAFLCRTWYFCVERVLLSGVPDYFYRNKISSGGDLSHYSSASLY